MSAEYRDYPSRFPIFTDISKERNRQDAKWGGVPGIHRRDDHTYAAVLGEEFGEVCKAWLERDVVGLREELIQTAAVAVAWIEELDNGGSLPRPIPAAVEDASAGDTT
jgi:NTP pyrophosphatase (non-canonical NTP hydrolase)